MSPILLFILLLLLTFAVLAYFLKPSAMEKAIDRQLAEIVDTPDATRGPTSILRDEAKRSTTVADEIASRLPGFRAVAGLIKQSGSNWRPSTVLWTSAAAAIGSAWFASLFSPLLLVSLATGTIAGLSPYIYLFIIREQRRRRFGNLLPEAVDLMSRALRAGHSIPAVLEMVGSEIADPVGVEFRALHKEQSLGLPLRDAMLNLIERMPLDDLRFLATAILLQKESGGNLAQILDKTAAVIRERARLRGQLRIYTAQGRITGWILCAAPFLMFALISVVNHDYEKTLFSTSMGLKMVYGGLGLMVLGILAIRKIIDVKV